MPRLTAVVLDASVAIGGCRPDATPSSGDNVLSQWATRRAIAPALWPLEVANALGTSFRADPRLRRRVAAPGGGPGRNPRRTPHLQPGVATACRQLSLSQPAVTLCDTAKPGQEAFLVTVLEAELAHGETQRRTRLLNRAGLPTLKTLDGYDRTRVRLPSPLTWTDLERWQGARDVGGILPPDQQNCTEPKRA